MFLKGISRSWFVNTIGIVALILIISITAISLMVQSSIYSGIELALTGRADELLNVLSSGSNGYQTSEFTAITRDYIETFPDKNDMEIMALSRTGQVLVTSTGFAPDQTQAMLDYEAALAGSTNAGKWIGHLDTGEKVMAITRVVRDDYGSIVGSIRYMVSMEKADQQILVIILTLAAIGLFILLLISLSGIYFIRSIVVPLRQISSNARQIARGEFDVRVERKKNDEIGQLCDAINDMASELGAAERMKNDFISSVSHELRTPLTAIKGWAETLHQGADPKTEEKGMEVIIRESERLSGLVEELLDFSRLQNGRMRLMVSRIDLLAELDEVVYLFTDRAKTEKKELLYEDSPSLAPVYGDVNRLRQVFINVIDNALKYSDSGDTVTIQARMQDGIIIISVADTGCGISAEDLPKVKTKFFKANHTRRGSGIGLAVADEIVQMHDGELQIESEVGKGTTVTIRLPVNLKKGEIRETEITTPAEQTETMQQGKESV